ncbi:TetR/AcrR family transcriptional regulator C-terminal domain-containing protein, partial [Streptomyces sp. FH025]|uniref:TetR/AcrR family transcriptional regulator C-terminal domain-containing protein n=1 Tax=Streptomyces sp. FH025 TaxID=2815937 RepID=UPI001A9D48A5
MPATPGDASPPRRRGRPARIDRARIVAAARELDPEQLTMQAVAERLGVVRKALNYHVSDREQLLELVALDALQTELAQAPAPDDTSWQQAIRSYAASAREAMVRTDTLFDYIRMPLTSGSALLETTDGLYRTLRRAGFTVPQAGRTVGLLAELLVSSARDAILVRRHGVHPQITEVVNLFDGTPDDRLPGLREWAGWDGAGPGDEQLAFDLDVLIAGLERLL